MKSIRRRVSLSLLLVLMAGLLGTAAAPSASANSVVWSRTVNGVTINLWYNQGWNWVSAEPRTFVNAGGEVGVWSSASGWRFTPSYYRISSRITTGAVWAPGNTCVLVYANIVDNYRPYTSRIQQTWQVC